MLPEPDFGPQPSGIAGTTYLWDPRNRLSSISLPPSIALPTGDIITNTYRWDDMRLSSSDMSGVNTMIWSGGQGQGSGSGSGELPHVIGLIGLPPPSGIIRPDMQQVFAWAPEGVGNQEGGAAIGSASPQNLASSTSLLRAMGVTSYNTAVDANYHADLQGSIIARTDPNGSGVGEYHSDAWGNVIINEGTYENPFIYLGGLGYWDDYSITGLGEVPGNGLKYVRARWMDSTVGQWLSVDPVRSESRYQYAHNSPTMRVDPSGRQDDDSILERAANAIGDDLRQVGSAIRRPISAGVRSARGYIRGAESALVGAAGWAGAGFASAAARDAADLRLAACLVGMGDLDVTERNLRGFDRPIWKAFVEQIAAEAERNDFASKSATGLRLIAADILEMVGPHTHETLGMLGAGADRGARASRISMPLILDPVGWNLARGNVPTDLQPFMPPHLMSPDGLRWAGGFMWGIFETALSAAHSLGSLIAHPINAVKEIYKALSAKGIWGVFVECLADQWHEFRDKITNLVHARAVFEQGEAAAILTIEIVSVLVLIATSVTGVGELAGLIKTSLRIVINLCKIGLKEGLPAAGRAALSLIRKFRATVEHIPGAPAPNPIAPPSSSTQTFFGGSTGQVPTHAILEADKALQRLRASIRKKMSGLKSGVPTAVRRLHRHHIYPQQFRPFFEGLGINIDSPANLVDLDPHFHQSGVHGTGGMPLPKWRTRIYAGIL
jgi:RHS repeat-associated protein